MLFIFKCAYKQIYSDPNQTQHTLDFEFLVNDLLSNIETNPVTAEDLLVSWNNRPLNRNLKYVAIRQTACLINMYLCLKEKLILNFINICELTMRSIRECNNDEQINLFYKRVNLVSNRVSGICFQIDSV